MASLKPAGPGRQPDSSLVKSVKAAVKLASNPALVVAVSGGVLAVKLQQLRDSGELTRVLEQLEAVHFDLPALWLLLGVAAALVCRLLWWLFTRPRVYLLDFVAKQPPDNWSHSRLDSERYAQASKQFTPESVDFQRKVLWFGGLGNNTYLPEWISTPGAPQDTSVDAAKKEFDLIVIQACKDLFDKTGIQPRQVGVLVVNCSLFCPTPSLAALIMNAFKMPSSTLSFNLGGMGCSASPIAIDLASRLLADMPNTYALVVSTENITQNMYKGTQRSMLIPNVLFRVGGAAMLLTNKRSEARRAKYWLHSVVRTNLAAQDDCYNCVMAMEDAEGNKGVKLSRDLMKIAGKALKQNITSLGPKLLPLSEIVVFAGNLVARQLLGKKAVAPYTPNFQEAAQHICIHTGGRGVVDAIQQELGLTDEYVEPSRAALYRYGNVSSSSIWYVLGFIEHYRGVKKGDKVWQIAFGSGFKCNSAVWVANRTFSEKTETWENFDLAAMYTDLSQLERQLNELLAVIGKPALANGTATPSSTKGDAAAVAG